MRRTFQQTLRAPMNRSTSKHAQPFSQSPRFRAVPQPACLTHSYDLSGQMMSTKVKDRRDSLSRSQRFPPERVQSPGPCHYRSHSSSQLRRVYDHRGIFNHEDRVMFQTTNTVPGPGTYSPSKLPTEKQISYSLRPRLSPSLQKKQAGAGPASYHTEQYDSFSPKKTVKYKSPGKVALSRSQRFLGPSNDVPGPGSYNQASPEKKIGNSTFGTAERQNKGVFKNGSPSPGPGAYYEFSQFAERYSRVNTNLKKMENLVGMRR